MEQSNLIAVIAIAISLVSKGLLLGSNFSLQNEISTINENQIRQTEELKNEIKELEETVEEKIEETESKLNQAEKKLDGLIEKNNSFLQKIEYLENRLRNLEAKTISAPLNPKVYEPTIIIDENGLIWESHSVKSGEIKGTDPKGAGGTNSNSTCYMNMNLVDTPYGKGVSVDSKGSADWGYWLLGVNEKYIVPKDGKITISGKFQKHDTFLPGQEVGRSYFLVLILSEDGKEILQSEKILTHEDANGEWHQKEVTFELEPDEIINVGLGRRDAWQADWNLYGAWTNVKIDAKKLE